ncbi:MAG: alginate O-acetyltransferase AlgX-related protein [Thermoleophilaceae bacterium]
MRRKTVLRALFAIIAVVFFATPIALRSVGVTATAFENKRFAEAPKPSQGWDVFDQTTRFLTDRMPLREQAVRANNRLWQTFFGTAPRYGSQTADGALPFAGEGAAAGPGDPASDAAQVLEGRDGWLFVKGALERACMPLAPAGPALKRWQELVSVVRSAGKPAVVTVPPDKGSIYAEHLRDGELTDCAQDARPGFWDLLSRAPRDAGVIALERPLQRLKQSTSVPLYSKTDSHWNSFAGLELVRAALDELGGGLELRPGEVVALGEREFLGDLTVLRGEQTKDARPEHTIRRRPGARRIGGRTLYVTDSFGDVPLPLVKLYFSNVRRLPWLGPTPGELTDEIAAADRVIFVTVEREFAVRGSDAGPISRDFLELLRERLGTG